VCQPRERLLRRRVSVNRRQASKVPRIQGLEQIEGLRSSHLADDDAIGPMPQRRADQVRDAHRGQGLFVAERRLRAPCLKPKEIGFVEMDLGRLFDHHETREAAGGVTAQVVPRASLVLRRASPQATKQ